MRPALGHDWSDGEEALCRNLECHAKLTHLRTPAGRFPYFTRGKRSDYAPTAMSPDWCRCYGKPAK